MGEMFANLFKAIATLFSATNRACVALDNLATVAEESSGAFVDESRHRRLMQQKLLAREASADQTVLLPE